MMKKILVYIILLNLFSANIRSQEVILKGEPAVIEDKPQWGPNRQNYFQTNIYFGLSIPGGEIDNLAKLILSGQLGLRAQYKRKISSSLAVLGEGAYERLAFMVGLNEMSWLDNSYYDREKIILNQISTAFLVRINPDIKRGNTLGKYVEAGFYLGYVFADRQVGTRTIEAPGKKEKITRTNLNYTVPFHYGLLARVGWNQYIIYYKINLTDYLDSGLAQHLLPRQSIGIGLKLGN